MQSFNGHYSRKQVSSYLEKPDTWCADELKNFEDHVEECDLCSQCLYDATCLGWKDSLSADNIPKKYVLPPKIEWIYGGQARVCPAVHSDLNQPVALKVARHDSAEASDCVRHEGQVLSRLHHPNIVAVYDLFKWGENVCLALEYLDGGSLAQKVGKLPTDSAVTLIVDVCFGVEYAHQKGVFHLDVTPKNILMDQHGRPRLIDFGIAMTRNGASKLKFRSAGTPGYIAPELMLLNFQRVNAGEAATTPDDLQRADVYSLAATLLTILSGKPPIYSQSKSSATGIPIEDRSIALPTALSPELRAVLRKGLSVKPENRYASVSEFREELERWRRKEPVCARPWWRLRKLRHWPSRNPTAALILSFCMLSAILASGLAIWLNRLVDSSLEVASFQAQFLARNNASAVERLDALKKLESYIPLQSTFVRLKEPYQRFRVFSCLSQASLSLDLGDGFAAENCVQQAREIEKSLRLVGTVDDIQNATALVNIKLRLHQREEDLEFEELERFLIATSNQVENLRCELLLAEVCEKLLETPFKDERQRSQAERCVELLISRPDSSDFSVVASRCAVALRALEKDGILAYQNIERRIEHGTKLQAIANKWTKDRSLDPQVKAFVTEVQRLYESLDREARSVRAVTVHIRIPEGDSKWAKDDKHDDSSFHLRIFKGDKLVGESKDVGFKEHWKPSANLEYSFDIPIDVPAEVIKGSGDAGLLTVAFSTNRSDETIAQFRIEYKCRVEKQSPGLGGTAEASQRHLFRKTDPPISVTTWKW